MKKDTSDVYASVWQSYLRTDLLPPEFDLLGELNPSWSQIRFLDLGVGAGRTTWTFCRIVKQYVGVDLAPVMVEQCRKIFGENEQRRFVVADASDLSQFPDRSFDVVLFSYNGIDHLNFEQRARCFQHIHRILEKGGSLFFSSHNLGVFPHNAWRAWHPGRNPIRWMRQFPGFLREWRFFEKTNTLAMSSEVQQRGWAMLPDSAHNYSMDLFYILPHTQVQHLQQIGFEVRKVLDMNGQGVDVSTHVPKHWYYHFLCRKP